MQHRNEIFEQSLSILYQSGGYSILNINLVDIRYSNVKISYSDIQIQGKSKFLF